MLGLQRIVSKNKLANYGSTIWLSIWLYDLAFGLPDLTHVVVFVGWVITVLALLKWPLHHTSNLYLKATSVVVLAFVLFGAFGALAGVLSDLSPVLELKYQKILLIIFQSILSSVIVAPLVAIPVASIYERNILLVVILSCTPITLVQLHGMYASTTLTGKVILGFEIVFRFIAVFVASELAHKALTNQSTRTSLHSAGV
jgi:hypothetical protein